VNDLKITRYMYPIEYPFAPAKVVDFFIEYYGPDQQGVRIAQRRKPDARRRLSGDMGLGATCHERAL